MSRDNEKRDGSELDITAEATQPNTQEPQSQAPKAKKLDAIRDFPEWLDRQLENIVEAYDEFSTSSSRRGYYGRGKK